MRNALDNGKYCDELEIDSGESGVLVMRSVGIMV
jgi:hypothetical protein